jgi:hypothetical protein
LQIEEKKFRNLSFYEHKMKNDNNKKIHKLPMWKREKTDIAPMIISRAM